MQFEAIDEISDSENVGSGSHSNRFDEGLIDSDSKHNGGGGGVSAKRIFKSAERSFRLQNKVSDYMYNNAAPVSNFSNANTSYNHAGSGENDSNLQGYGSSGGTISGMG